MPFVKRDGADLYWETSGSDRPRLLPPVSAACSAIGSRTARLWNGISRSDPFDQRGTGKSSKTSVASIEQMSADLIAVMDAAGFPPRINPGHSTGGAIGCRDRARSSRPLSSPTDPRLDYAWRSVSAPHLPICAASFMPGWAPRPMRNIPRCCCTRPTGSTPIMRL